MKKSLIGIVLSFIVIFSFSVLVSASGIQYFETDGTTSRNEIELSKNILNKAKKKASKQKEKFNFEATISSEYKVQIYHFEAPSSGYYAFYTLGDSDTIIKIYEHKNFLWATTNYSDLGLNDDGSMADKNNSNASMVLNLTSGEDYYICVRLFEKKTGNYKLVVEPNKDKMLRSKYGYNQWNYKKLSTSSILLQSWTYSKRYLNKNEVILLYFSLDPACKDLVGYDIDYVHDLYENNTNEYYKAMDLIVNTLLAFIDLNPLYSISLTFMDTVFDYLYETSTKDPYELMEFLHNECGVTYDGNKWSSTNGLVIIDFFNANSVPTSIYKFEKYDSDILEGDEYEKGSWSN